MFCLTNSFNSNGDKVIKKPSLSWINFCSCLISEHFWFNQQALFWGLADEKQKCYEIKQIDFFTSLISTLMMQTTFSPGFAQAKPLEAEWSASNDLACAQPWARRCLHHQSANEASGKSA